MNRIACCILSKSQLSARSYSRFTKPIITATEAIEQIPSGSTILVGGFGLCGIPENLIKAMIAKKSLDNLTIVSNDAGVDDYGLGPMVEQRQIKRIIASYIGETAKVGHQYLAGELEVELTPQGTLAERLRAGGAGIPLFFTATAVGTDVQYGKLVVKYGSAKSQQQILSKPRETRQVNGQTFVLEEALTGDFGLVKGWKADKYGNVIFRRTARNFNPLVGRAANITIAEVEEIVPVGSLDPENIHLPGIYVDQLVLGSGYEKRIEKLTLAHEQLMIGSDSDSFNRERIARRVAQEFKDGMYINLGIGIPTLASNFVPKGMTVQLQSENGILGLGPFPTKDKVDPELIDAGKETVTILPGSAIFASDDSFAMIRGGHVDLTILGAMQVSQLGDLANWIVPGKLVKGMGGAMDLAASGTNLIVAMNHVSKLGEPKILKSCTLPLTGRSCVNKIITELCVFEVDHRHGLELVELCKNVSIEEVKQKTACDFLISHQLKYFE